ncbi:MAG: VOC family protein [Chloroflexi bacterium]|nr:VOC family protein [Chloroflexota bacterium]
MSRVQLALNVAELDSAIDFYSQMFRTEPHKVRPGYANFEVEDPPLKLVLIENANAAAPLNHLGVEVETAGEVVAETQRFGQLGLDLEIEDGVVCCHAEQDKVWVADPSGTRWEVYTITDDLPEASYASRAANLIPLTEVAAGASSIEDCCADGGLCVG